MHSSQPITVKLAVMLLIVTTFASMSYFWGAELDEDTAEAFGTNFYLIMAGIVLLLWLTLTAFIYFKKRWARNVTCILLALSLSLNINSGFQYLEILDVILLILEFLTIILLILPVSNKWFSSKTNA